MDIFRLMKEAAIEAKQGGESGITVRSVKKVTAVSPHVRSWPRKARLADEDDALQDTLAKFKG